MDKPNIPYSSEHDPFMIYRKIFKLEVFGIMKVKSFVKINDEELYFETS